MGTVKPTETEEEANATAPEMPREEEQAETSASPSPQSTLRFLKLDSGPVGLESVIQATQQFRVYSAPGLAH